MRWMLCTICTLATFALLAADADARGRLFGGRGGCANGSCGQTTSVGCSSGTCTAIGIQGTCTGSVSVDGFGNCVGGQCSPNAMVYGQQMTPEQWAAKANATPTNILTITIPDEGAEIYLDGHATLMRGQDRAFTWKGDKGGTYSIRARWRVGMNVKEETKVVQVQPGQANAIGFGETHTAASGGCQCGPECICGPTCNCGATVAQNRP